MGGILTGGAYTTAPEAWGAMGVQSGVFNAVRLLAAKNGANQVAEMGDPRTEAGMQQPVSYTHLDVYKRQMMHWVMRSAPALPNINTSWPS